MATHRTSRILPIVLVVIIIIIIIAALVSITRVIFSNANTATPAEVTDTSRDALLTTTVNRSVSMTVRGPIVADESFHSYKIVISPESRSLTTYTGYLDAIVKEDKRGNNVAAYEEFVYALDKANLAKGEELKGDENDIRGRCATGRVYEFSILNNGEPVKHLWTSTCRGSQGSLDASVSQLTELFQGQVPDAARTIRAVNL